MARSNIRESPNTHIYKKSHEKIVTNHPVKLIGKKVKCPTIDVMNEIRGRIWRQAP